MLRWRVRALVRRIRFVRAKSPCLELCTERVPARAALVPSERRQAKHTACLALNDSERIAAASPTPQIDAALRRNLSAPPQWYRFARNPGLQQADTAPMLGGLARHNVARGPARALRLRAHHRDGRRAGARSQ